MASLPVSVIDQVAASLSVTTLRHEAIASNIANRDTQGYQRMQVRFSQALSDAGRAELVPENTAGPVSLEQDLVALSSNSMRFEAMAKALGHYFSILAVISNPNRG